LHCAQKNNLSVSADSLGPDAVVTNGAARRRHRAASADQVGVAAQSVTNVVAVSACRLPAKKRNLQRYMPLPLS